MVSGGGDDGQKQRDVHKTLVSEMHNLTAMIEDELFIGNKKLLPRILANLESAARNF